MSAERSISMPQRSSHDDGILVLSPNVAIEENSPESLVIFDALSGRRLRIARSLYELMKHFSTPTRPSDISGIDDAPLASEALAKLVELGFLIKQNHRAEPRPQDHLCAVSPTLFRVPSHHSGLEPADIAIVGIPYDGGNIMGGGSRFGPALIRLASCEQEYRVDFLSGRPRGWYELDSDTWVLKGVTISDHGDLRIIYGECQERLFRRIEDVSRKILLETSFPLFLGGDHSISYPIVKAVQSAGPVSVIWMDAHNDCGRWEPGTSHNHGNVVRRILELENVARVVHVGQRGYALTDQPGSNGSRIAVLSAAQSRRRPEALVDLVPSGPCYLSIDIDVLDPAYAPGTSTPVPGGLSPDELMTMIRILAAHRPIVGMDMVEVNGERDASKVTALHASYIIMATLAVVRQHKPAHQS